MLLYYGSITAINSTPFFPPLNRQCTRHLETPLSNASGGGSTPPLSMVKIRLLFIIVSLHSYVLRLLVHHAVSVVPGEKSNENGW